MKKIVILLAIMFFCCEEDKTENIRTVVRDKEKEVDRSGAVVTPNGAGYHIGTGDSYKLETEDGSVYVDKNTYDRTHVGDSVDVERRNGKLRVKR